MLYRCLTTAFDENAFPEAIYEQDDKYFIIKIEDAFDEKRVKEKAKNKKKHKEYMQKVSREYVEEMLKTRNMKNFSNETGKGIISYEIKNRNVIIVVDFPENSELEKCVISLNKKIIEREIKNKKATFKFSYKKNAKYRIVSEDCVNNIYI